MKKTIYAGTYAGTGSKGIYSFDLEDGIITKTRLFAEAQSPKYITRHRDCIAAVSDFDGGSGAQLFAMDGTLLSGVRYEPVTSCYIGSDGEYLYTANFHEGTFTVLESENGQLHVKKTVLIRKKAGCHQVLPFRGVLLVPCLYLDRVMIFDRSTLEKTGEIEFAAGTGPRHGVFSHDGKYLYLVSELSNEMFVIRTADWKIIFSMPVLENGETHIEGGAAVRLDSEGKFLYVSTRGRDVISVISLQSETPHLAGVFPCGGEHPRDFILSGEYLLSANRFSSDVTVFRLRDGLPAEQTSSVKIPEPVSLFEEN